MPELKQILNKIETYRDVVIDLETKLTAIPALSPASGGDGEMKKAMVIKEYLQGLGISDIVQLDAPDHDVTDGVRPNLIATIPGVNRDKAVWLMAHMDVVPPGDLDKWDSDPWTVRVDGDKIYGRGVEDNQQGMCSAFMVAKAFLEEGVTPPVDIKLLLVADEETGNALGIGHVMKEAPFKPHDLIIVPDGGLPDGSQIEVAEKGILWLKFTVRGGQCHAAMPQKGNNAMRAGAYLVTALDELQQTFDKQDPVFDPPASTFEPTKHEPNVSNVNTIPGEDIFFLDCRVLPDYQLDEVMAKAEQLAAGIAERFKVETIMEIAQRADAAPATPTDAPVVTALKAAVKDIYGIEGKAEGIGGGTVAAWIRKGGFNAVVWSKMDETMHGPNEYAILPNILGDAKVFAHVIWNA